MSYRSFMQMCLVAFGVGCGPRSEIAVAPTQSEHTRNSASPILTDSSSYTLLKRQGLIHGTIRFVYTNASLDTVYLTRCGRTHAHLERSVG